MKEVEVDEGEKEEVVAVVVEALHWRGWKMKWSRWW